MGGNAAVELQRRVGGKRQGASAGDIAGEVECASLGGDASVVGEVACDRAVAVHIAGGVDGDGVGVDGGALEGEVAVSSDFQVVDGDTAGGRERAWTVDVERGDSAVGEKAGSWRSSLREAVVPASRLTVTVPLETETAAGKRTI